MSIKLVFSTAVLIEQTCILSKNLVLYRQYEDKTNNTEHCCGGRYLVVACGYGITVLYYYGCDLRWGGNINY